jgi:hypothetical protein
MPYEEILPAVAGRVKKNMAQSICFGEKQPASDAPDPRPARIRQTGIQRQDSSGAYEKAKAPDFSGNQGLLPVML